MLKSVFITAARTHCGNLALIEKRWDEISSAYSEKRRYYHNLNHLENMLSELIPSKSEIDDWDGMVMALVYHDIVYKATASDNEEKSATLTKMQLSELRFPENKIARCHEMILATKGHTVSATTDVNLFTDADLSILGKSWDVYQHYFHNIRKEYSIYPDLLYNPGRKKVLKHFLGMPRIFKTNRFYDHYEEQAKQNLKNELRILTS